VVAVSKRKPPVSPSMRAHFAGSETRKPIVITKVAHPTPVKPAAPPQPPPRLSAVPPPQLAPWAQRKGLNRVLSAKDTTKL